MFYDFDQLSHPLFREERLILPNNYNAMARFPFTTTNSVPFSITNR